MTKQIQKTIRDYQVTDVVVLAGNSKDHPVHQIEQLKKNIQQYGFTQPILVSERGELIAGHGRMMAAQELGWSTVPTIVVEGLTQEEARALRISDNRISELGVVNESALAMELAELSAELESLDGLGFMADELGNLLEAYTIDDEPEEKPAPRVGSSGSAPRGPDKLVEAEPEKGLPSDFLGKEEEDPPAKISSNPGDVWLFLGQHRLVCGESVDHFDHLLDITSKAWATLTGKLPVKESCPLDGDVD